MGSHLTSIQLKHCDKVQSTSAIELCSIWKMNKKSDLCQSFLVMDEPFLIFGSSFLASEIFIKTKLNVDITRSMIFCHD